MCESYQQAVASVHFIENKREGDLFVLLTQEMLMDDPEYRIKNNSSLLQKSNKHVCKQKVELDDGELNCISDHILVK